MKLKKFRKIALLVLAVTSLTLVLAGCGSNDSDGGNNDVAYNDGTYNGESEKREFGYEAAEVTITDGEISDIVLKRMTPDGEEVDYDEWTGEDDKPNLKQFRQDLAEDMMSKQSYEVDTIATATESANGWKEAVKNALADAK